MKTSFTTLKHGLTAVFIAGLMSTTAMAQQAGAQQKVPELVRADGSYPTVKLEKDVIVLKVVQNAPSFR